MEIVRRLPPERVAQVLDFAEFLASRSKQQNGSDVVETDASAAEATASDVRWDALLASDESQHLLERMADEAEAQIAAGQAQGMVFMQDGQTFVIEPADAFEQEVATLRQSNAFMTFLAERSKQKQGSMSLDELEREIDAELAHEATRDDEHS